MVEKLIVSVVKGQPLRATLVGVSPDGARSILTIPRDLYGSREEFFDAVRQAALSGGAPDAKDKRGQ